MGEETRRLAHCFGHCVLSLSTLSPRFARVAACLVASLLAPILLAACVDSSAVTIRKEKMYPQKHTIGDDEAPKQGGGHHCETNTNTSWDFHFTPVIAVTKVKAIKEAHWYSTTVKVKCVTAQMSLPFNIWAPKDPSDEFVAHQDGHVRICRLFYRDAAHQARKCALHVIGREYTGEAKDEATAEKLAIHAVAEEITRCYRERIVEPATRASEAYDKLTAKGPNQMSVPDAIEKAIAEAQSTPTP